MTLLILLFSFYSMASGETTIGGYANSNFENMTCKEMIARNLPLQIESTKKMKAASANIIEECKVRSFVGHVINSFTRKTDRCLAEIQKIESQVKTESDFFASALDLRIELYDAKFLTQKGRELLVQPKLCPEPKSNKMRNSDTADLVFIREKIASCSLKFYPSNVVESSTADYNSSPLSKLYKDKAAFEDRQVCKKFVDEYRKTEPLKLTRAEAKPVANAADSNAGTSKEIKCQVLECKKLLEATQGSNSSFISVNTASPCYKDAILSCIVSGADLSNGQSSNKDFPSGDGKSKSDSTSGNSGSR